MYLSRSFLMSALLCSLLGCSSSSSTTSKPADVQQPEPKADVEQPIPGGGCEYVRLPGTCEITSPDAMTYRGMVDGAEVTLEGNHVTIATDEGPFANPVVGTTGECTLNFATKGGCTPCETSLGGCGQQAWDAHSAFSARH
jgi:hypothetical protein